MLQLLAHVMAAHYLSADILSVSILDTSRVFGADPSAEFKVYCGGENSVFSLRHRPLQAPLLCPPQAFAASHSQSSPSQAPSASARQRRARTT